VHYKAGHRRVVVGEWRDTEAHQMDALVDSDKGGMNRMVHSRDESTIQVPLVNVVTDDAIQQKANSSSTHTEDFWKECAIVEVLGNDVGHTANQPTHTTMDTHAPKGRVVGACTTRISSTKHLTRPMTFRKDISNILPSVLSYGVSSEVQCCATEDIELKFGAKTESNALPSRNHSGMDSVFSRDDSLLLEEEDTTTSTTFHSNVSEPIQITEGSLLPPMFPHTKDRRNDVKSSLIRHLPSNHNHHLIQFVNSTSILIEGREDAMELGVRLCATEVQCNDDRGISRTVTLVNIHFWSQFKKTVWGFTQMIDNLIFQQTETSYAQWLDLVQQGIRSIHAKKDPKKWNALLPLIDFDAEVASEPLVYFCMETGDPLSLSMLHKSIDRRQSLSSRRGMHRLFMSTALDREQSEDEDELNQSDTIQNVSSIPSNMTHTILSDDDTGEDEEFFDAEFDASLQNTLATPLSPKTPSHTAHAATTPSQTPRHITLRQLKQQINDLSCEAQQTKVKLKQLQKKYSNQKIQECVDEYLDQLNGIWKQCQLSYDTLQREKKYHESMYETLLHRSFDQIRSLAIGFMSGLMFAALLWMLKHKLRWSDYFALMWRFIHKIGVRLRLQRGQT